MKLWECCINIICIFLLFLSAEVLASTSEHSNGKALINKDAAQNHQDVTITTTEQDLVNALALLHETPNQAQEFKILIKQAYLAKKQKHFSKSIAYLNKAKLLRDDISQQQLDKDSPRRQGSLDFNLLIADVDLFQLEAELLYSQNKFDEAISLLDEALFLVERTGNNPGLLYRLFEMKAVFYQKQKQYSLALTSYLLAQHHIHIKSSTVKIQLWNEIAFLYTRLNDNYSAIKYFKRALTALEKDNQFTPQERVMRDLPHKAKVLLNISRSYKKAGSFKEALNFGSRALTVAKDTDNEEFTLKSLVQLSIIYRRLSSYENALEYGVEALQIYKKNNDLNGMASSYNAIGLIYKRLGHREKAQTYFNKVINLPKELIQQKYYAAALRELALYHFYQEDYSAALSLNDHAYQIYEKLDDLKGKATVKKNEGRIYRAIGNVKLAFNAFEFAVETSRLAGDAWEQATNLAHIALLYAHEKPEKTKYWADKSLRIANRIQAKPVIEQVYLALSISAEKMQDFQLALTYAKLQAQTLNEIKTDTISTHNNEVNALQNVIDKMHEIDTLNDKVTSISTKYLKQNSELMQLKQKSEDDDEVIQHLQIIILILLSCVLFFTLRLNKIPKA